MRKYSKDIMWGLIAIVIVMFFLTGKIYIFPVIIIVCLAFSLGRDESQYYENQHHDTEDQERTSDPMAERSSFSLRVDESQFWENRHHDEEPSPDDSMQEYTERGTDYSGLNPDLLGDNYKKR